MRNDSLRRLIAVLSCLVASTALAGEDDALSARIEPAGALHAGEHARIAVHVTLPERVLEDTPLLLTPRIEGAAVEVMRGRLFRADGQAAGPRKLVFQLPMLARHEGTAILRVEVSTYVCSKRCEAITAVAQQTLRVDAR